MNEQDDKQQVKNIFESFQKAQQGNLSEEEKIALMTEAVKANRLAFEKRQNEARRDEIEEDTE